MVVPSIVHRIPALECDWLGLTKWSGPRGQQALYSSRYGYKAPGARRYGNTDEGKRWKKAQVLGTHVLQYMKYKLIYVTYRNIHQLPLNLRPTYDSKAHSTLLVKRSAGVKASTLVLRDTVAACHFTVFSRGTRNLTNSPCLLLMPSACLSYIHLGV